MTETPSKPTTSSDFSIAVNKDLDLYGLNPYEFRIYGHIARRKECYSSLKTMAAICHMSVRQAQYALKGLEEKNLIIKKKRKGSTDIYRITNKSEWKQIDYSNELKSGVEYFNRALIRRERKDFQGAFQDFQKSVELFKQELQVKNYSVRKEKDLEDAEKELLKTEKEIQSLFQQPFQTPSFLPQIPSDVSQQPELPQPSQPSLPPFTIPPYTESPF